jgi:hypothetical protein
MKITISSFNPANGTVSVTFKDGEFVHTRTVNAVIDATNLYDKAATKARVEEVALGVIAKRARGVFDTAAPPAD